MMHNLTFTIIKTSTQKCNTGHTLTNKSIFIYHFKYGGLGDIRMGMRQRGKRLNSTTADVHYEQEMPKKARENMSIYTRKF
jgi:hypothetical protein